MTPEQYLKYLRPAFLDLFKDEQPDLARFLRLAIDVLDPNAGYGPHKCAGDGTFLPLGCGKIVTFKVADRDGSPYAAQCPECGVVYPFSFTKGLKSASQRAVLTATGSTVGSARSESASCTIIDTHPITVEMKK